MAKNAIKEGIKPQKIAKNDKKNAKNANETLNIYCILNPIVVGNLRSIKHTWYLPKNSPKIAKKWQKPPKNKRKLPKWLILHSKICPLEMFVFICFPTHLLGLSCTFWTPQL